MRGRGRQRANRRVRGRTVSAAVAREFNRNLESCDNDVAGDLTFTQ
jgi:hypothetical protein